jgi:hypothetical protein
MTFADLTTAAILFVDANTLIHLFEPHNDAITVALMQAHGLNKIASSDADFDHVPGLTRYAPV